MIGKVRRRLLAYRQRGLARSARIAVDTLALSAARRIFGFGPWHAEAPTSLRTYRIPLAAMANSLDAVCVVEVGCGLGAVLARIEAPIRVGYDVDDGAIRAARMLRSRSITFRVGSFPEVVEPSIDLLIAVNWLHDFPADQIDRWLTRLLPRTRYLLVDGIAPSSPVAYRHFHDFAFLASRTACIRRETPGGESREFLLLEVKR